MGLNWKFQTFNTKTDVSSMLPENVGTKPSTSEELLKFSLLKQSVCHMLPIFFQTRKILLFKLCFGGRNFATKFKENI